MAHPRAVEAPVSTPKSAVGERTFMAHEGDVWRSSHAPHYDWSSLLPQTCERLLAGFRSNSLDTADWFHKRAGQLADELEAAMSAAAEQRKARKAA